MPAKTAENVVRFTLGGLLFEYNPEKNRKILRNTEYPLKAPRVCFSTMTVLNFMMRLIVGMRTAMM